MKEREKKIRKKSERKRKYCIDCCLITYSFIFECTTFAPATIAPMINANVNVTPTLTLTLIQILILTLTLPEPKTQIITLTLTLCYLRYHCRSNCCRSKCGITSFSLFKENVTKQNAVFCILFGRQSYIMPLLSEKVD